MDLRTYHVCLLRKGPTWTAEESPELEQLQADHLAHKHWIREIGAAIASGPVDDESDLRGFTIYTTPTLAEAQALAEADPMVRANRLIVELHTWRVPAGLLPDPIPQP